MTWLILVAVISPLVGFAVCWLWMRGKVSRAERGKQLAIDIAREQVQNANKVLEDPANHPARHPLADVIDWVKVDHQARSARIVSGGRFDAWLVTLKHTATRCATVEAQGSGILPAAVSQALDAIRKAAN